MPVEEDTVVYESGQEMEQAPSMRGRLKARRAEWRRIGAGKLPLEWVERGFVLWFDPRLGLPKFRLKNQQSCFESVEAMAFLDEAVRVFSGRGVIDTVGKGQGLAGS